MLRIANAPLSRMRSSQHLLLMTEFLRLVLEYSDSKLRIEDWYPSFLQAVAEEEAAIKVEQGSKFTEKIDDLIILREKYFGVFRNLVDNGLDHYDPAVVEDAKLLERLVNKYNGILKKTKAEKLVDFKLLTNDLQQPEYAPATVKIGAGEWVAKIKEINDECTHSSANRDKEGSVRPDGNVHDARLIVDPLYYAMTERINAGVVMFGESDYAGFINQLNVKIENLKVTLAQQKAAKKNTTTDTKPVK